MTTQNYTRTCQVCETEYKTRQINKDGSPRKTMHCFCGQKCADKYWNALRTGRPRDSWKFARECTWCGRSFHPTSPRHTKFCTGACRYASQVASYRPSKPRTHHCKECKAEYRTTMPWSIYCSAICKQRAKSRTATYKYGRRERDARRRARKRTSVTQRINPFDVFARYKWRCHLCGCKTPKNLRGTMEDKAPELEHIIPLSAGGTHTWDNVACSCRKCNRRKGSETIGQLGFNLA